MENIIFKTNIKELEKRINNLKPNSGTCVIDSFITFQKLYKIGSKRVRGKINNKALVVDYNYELDDESDLTHYWVEAKGFVYDNNSYQTRIMPINEYYKLLNITDVEYAAEGIFNKNNYILGSGPDRDDMINKYLLPFCECAQF